MKAAQRIVDLAFAGSTPIATRRLLAASLLGAAGLHAGLAICLPGRAPLIPAAPHITRQAVVEIAALPSAPAAPVDAEPAPAPARAAARARPAHGALAPTPAQAPLDLTDSVFVGASAPAAHPGAQAAGNSAPGTAHGSGGAGSATGQRHDHARHSHARPVSLASDDWSCPWPEQAQSLELDEVSVLLRVTIESDGRVSAARVLRAGGYGFDSAALACAHRARFRPALDQDGVALRAESPPIEVHFWR